MRPLGWLCPVLFPLLGELPRGPSGLWPWSTALPHWSLGYAESCSIPPEAFPVVLQAGHVARQIKWCVGLAVMSMPPCPRFVCACAHMTMGEEGESNEATDTRLPAGPVSPAIRPQHQMFRVMSVDSSTGLPLPPTCGAHPPRAARHIQSALNALGGVSAQRPIVSPTRGATPQRGSPYPQLERPHQSVGVRIPTQGAKAWVWVWVWVRVWVWESLSSTAGEGG